MRRQQYLLDKSLRLILKVGVLGASMLASAAFAQNPVPQIVGPVRPQAVAPGSGAFTLTVYGANFVSGAVVNWNHQPRSTTFVSAHELRVQILSSDVSKNTAGTVTVTNPPPGGGYSSASFAQVEVHAPTATIVPGYPILAPMQYPFGSGSIVLADFNGDNILDLMYGGIATLGLGNGKFRFDEFLRSYRLGFGMTYGDFNNDGKLDLAYTAGDASGYGPGKSIQIMLGDGTGKFNKVPTVLQNLDTFSWVVAGDFNGDGKLDLVTMDLLNIYVYLGNGDGTFQPRRAYPFPGEGEGISIQLGDFNGDGRLDLLTSVGSQGALYVLLGNGDGTFQPAVEVAAGGATGCQGFGQPQAIIDDFNGDGRLDIAGCNPNEIDVFLGNGDGTFQPPSIYTITPPAFFSAISGDFNSDGNTDLLVSSYSPAFQLAIFLGNGDGSFQAGQVVKLSKDDPGEMGMAAGDFNADGLVDFINVTAQGPCAVYTQK